MEKVRKILFWCMLMGFAVKFLWMGMIIFGGEWIYSFHSNLWGLNELFSKDCEFYRYWYVENGSHTLLCDSMAGNENRRTKDIGN
ncbi:MAG: DUF6868 family protein [Planctomycetota bacterium]|jgi:hypothetical protein